MADLAVIVLLPDKVPDRIDTAAKEVDGSGGVAAAIDELDAKGQPWRAITVVHIEDLPVLLEGAFESPDDG